MVQQVAAQLNDRITDDEDQILEGSAADYQDYSGDHDEYYYDSNHNSTFYTYSSDSSSSLGLKIKTAVQS